MAEWSATALMEKLDCAIFVEKCERRQRVQYGCDSKVWIGVGDIVLIGLRDFQDDKADIIMKYTPDEARQLKAYGEIPENGNKSDEALYVETIDNNETNDGGDEDACVFQFEIDSIYFCLFKLA